MRTIVCSLFILVSSSLFIPLKSSGQISNQIGQFAPGYLNFDSTQIASFLLAYPKMLRYKDELHTFYRKRHFSYAWYQDGKLVERVGSLQNRLRNLKDDGVYQKLVYLDILDSLVSETYISYAPKIELELLLTSEYFIFSNLVWEGMSAAVSKDNDWLLPRKKISYELYLDSILETGAPRSAKLKPPVYRQYELLKANLKFYRKLDSAQDWNPVSTRGQVISRLILLKDYSGSIVDGSDSTMLKKAVIHFQKRHGLQPNGRIDKATLVALNIPLKSRIRQILVNMERTRWLPITTIGDYIAVNIPEFQMHVYRSDSLYWSSNAVVGRVANATTLFYGEINQVVFSPYWNVPESIVRKEILPAIKKDGGYLSKHNMEIIGQRNKLPIVRQKPGNSNALGRVKFLFPNSYSIYLHDTPGKSLFTEVDRAFSHGCIRIEQPEKLAAFLLKADSQWNKNSISTAMHLGKEKSVTVSKKVPVYIVYMTAFVDRQNQLNFRKDIYGLDSKLASTIISGEGIY
jgi:murein L,D-transpeptidase YcbB/YkuD